MTEHRKRWGRKAPIERTRENKEGKVWKEGNRIERGA